MKQKLLPASLSSSRFPLGLAIALSMPRKGPWVSVCLVLMALPLLIPWNVVGAMWNIMALPDIGLLGEASMRSASTYNYTRQPIAAWFTVVLMDVWHWTSLVVLLCYAGLVSIPDAYYQAAKVDGARTWAVFRYIQLPKLRHVLTIAMLLRFMDSFMIYTEAVVLTGGGPGSATTFLSIDLVKTALGQFDLGPAAAMSIIYFLIILLLSWLFYTLMMRERGEVTMRSAVCAGPGALHHLPDAADLLAAEHVVQDHQRDPRRLLALAARLHTRQLRKIFTDPSWYMGYINSLEYVVINTVLSVVGGAAGGLCLLALPLPRRQAPVLLAADQPHGAAGGFRAAVLPALFGGRPVRHALGGGAGPHPLQHSAGGVDPRGLHVGRAEGARRDRLSSTAIPSGASSSASSCRPSPPASASPCFFCFMFSWVELLLAKTLTAVAAKPIAAAMTKTASTSGYELAFLRRPAR